ncbi:MAG: hypothetical protein Q8O31_04820, partial [Rhodocyclaceae bacterium]|nr:hypothetical protein [Rhodocyclaceae bacterium]
RETAGAPCSSPFKGRETAGAPCSSPFKGEGDSRCALLLPLQGGGGEGDGAVFHINTAPRATLQNASH